MEALTQNLSVTTDGKTVCTFGRGCATQRGVKTGLEDDKTKQENYSLLANSHMYECRYTLDL